MKRGSPWRRIILPSVVALMFTVGWSVTIEALRAAGIVTLTTARPRLGIFGTGRMGRVHLEHLVRLHRAGRIDFVAMGDPLPATLDAARAQVATLGEEDLARDLAAAPTADGMATATRLDAVVVASRTEDHARDIVAFARRGIPVLVEKPVTSSIAEAAAIAGELGAAADRLVQVAFQRHYDEATRAAAGGWSRG